MSYFIIIYIFRITLYRLYRNVYKMNNLDKLKQIINDKCMELIKVVNIIKYMFIVYDYLIFNIIF